MKIENRKNSFLWSYGLPSLIATIIATLVLTPAALFLSETKQVGSGQGPLLAASIALFILLTIVHQYLAWKSKRKFSKALNSLHFGIKSLSEASHSEELATEQIPEEVKQALSQLNDEIIGLRKTAAELKQVVSEKEHQKSLTVTAADAVDWEYESSSKIFKVDKEWRDRLGFPKQKDPSEFLSQIMPEDRENLLQQLSRQEDSPIEVPVRLHKEHGTTRWLTVKGQAVDKKRDLLTGVLIDLTPVKVLEGNQAISERMEDLGRLAGGIAHEINTPMQFLGDNLGFIKKGQGRIEQYLGACEELLQHQHLKPALSAELEELAELKKKLKVERMLNRLGQATTDSEEGVERVAAIVKAMKEYAHPETDNKAECDLNSIVNTALTVGRSEWKYVAKAELELAEDLESLQAFPGELTQVVLNIVTNAAHALNETKDQREEPGVIKIETKNLPDLNSVRLSISDNGPGIPKEIQEKVFEQSFTTKPAGAGTGLGLTISKKIVEERHSGTIELESNSEKGTTFQITLPLSKISNKESTEVSRVQSDF